MSGIVRVEGRRYLAGLFWYPVNETGKGQQKEIRALAEEQGAQWIVLRGANPEQVGLVLDPEGKVKNNLPSVAATIANRLNGSGYRSFLVAYETDDHRWLYIAAQNGILLHDGDRVGSEEEVRERIQAEIDAGLDWNLVVAPPTWGIENASPFGRLELFPASRFGRMSRSDAPVARPVKVNVARRAAVLAATAGVVVAAVAGFNAYERMKEAQALEEAAEVTRAEETRLAQIKPWARLPGLAVWGPRCVDSILARASDVAGWKVKDAVCNAVDGVLTVSWVREPGARASDLQDVEPGVAFFAETEPAIARKAYDIKPAQADPFVDTRDAPTRSVFEDRLADALYVLGPARPKLKAAPPSSATKYSAIDWTSDTSELPSLIFDFMNQSGATLVSVSIGPSLGINQQWKVEGKQYVR